MHLFNLLLLSTFFFGSFATSYSAETVTTGSCFSNPSTYIGRNIPIAGAAINVWQVMQGMEALTLLLNVQEKDIHPRLDLLPVPAKDLVKRVLKKIKRTYPKFLSDRTIRENKNEHTDEYSAQAWYAIPTDQSPIDIMRAVREYLHNNPHAAKDAKDYMQLHWFLWMLLSTIVRGISFGDTYEGVRSSVMVGGINLLENVAVEAISDRAHLSEHMRCSVHGGVKLGLLCASLFAQLLSSRQSDYGSATRIHLLPEEPLNHPIVHHQHEDNIQVSVVQPHINVPHPVPPVPPAPPMPQMAPPPPPCPMPAPGPLFKAKKAPAALSQSGSLTGQIEQKKLKTMTSEEREAAEKEKAAHKKMAQKGNPLAGVDFGSVQLRKTIQVEKPATSETPLQYLKEGLEQSAQNEKPKDYKGPQQLAIEDTINTRIAFLQRIAAVREATKGDDERADEEAEDRDGWD